MPCGVDTMMIFEVFDEDTVGNTEFINSSSMPGFKNANSSHIRTLILPPRPELPLVASAVIVHPLSNTILPLFHSTIPRLQPIWKLLIRHLNS